MRKNNSSMSGGNPLKAGNLLNAVKPLKVALIGVNASFNHTNLAILYLKCYCREFLGEKAAGVRCIEFTINDPVREDMEVLLAEKADIYAFSCYIWNISIILEMTEMLKKLHPDCLLVLGGPEVSFENETFFSAHPEIDCLIQGPGEKAFASLVLALSDFLDESGCPGDFHLSERLIAGETVPLHKIPFVYSDEDFTGRQKQYYYETSRGCPFRCSYCLSSAFKGLDLLPMERVREDLDFFIDQNISLLKLVDRTFNHDDRRAMEIWRFLIEKHRREPFSTRFHFEIAADLLSEEALSLLSEAPVGLFQFEIGVQTTNQEVLETIRRKTSLEKITRNVIRLKAMKNIAIHLDLIAGLPSEDWHSFSKSFNEVFSLRPDALQLGFLKVLKGSPVRDETDKFHLVYINHPPYEVLSTGSMSFHEMNRLKNIEDLVERYYNSTLFHYSLEYILGFFPDPFEFFNRLEIRWREKGGFHRALSRKDLIFEFHSFGIHELEGLEGILFSEEEKKAKTRLFSDLVKFDYYRFDKKGLLEGLDFNGSHHHPSLPRSLEKASWYKPGGQPVCIKPRLERYSFDAEQLIGLNRIAPAVSYVLYEMSGNRPRIFDLLVLKEPVCGAKCGE